MGVEYAFLEGRNDDFMLFFQLFLLGPGDGLGSFWEQIGAFSARLRAYFVHFGLIFG